MSFREFLHDLITPVDVQLAELRAKRMRSEPFDVTGDRQMNMECGHEGCGHNHAGNSHSDLPDDFAPKPAGFNLTPDETGVCRFEADPEAIAAIRHAARMLRAAKQAHTEWEARFEGPVPAHDWETWYAQWMLAQTVRGTGHPVVPCSIGKLGALVGSLD
jgi:hypothetical protein